MSNVYLNKEAVHNHFHYEWWKYVVAIFAIFIGWELIFTVTKPSTPANLKVDAYLMGDYMDPQYTTSLSKKALKDFTNQKEINFINSHLGDSKTDPSGWTKLSVYLNAGEGDVYIFDQEVFNAYVSKNCFLPLESYINNGTIKLDTKNALNSASLEKLTLSSDNLKGKHLFGLPADSLKGLDKMGFSTKNKIVVVTSYSKNTANSVKLVNWLFENLSN